MAITKEPKSPRSKPTNGAPAATSAQPEVNGDALLALNRTLKELTGRLSQVVPQKAGVKGGKAPHLPASEEGVAIRIWEDDPFLEAVGGRDPVVAEPISVEEPTNEHELLQTRILGASPDPDLYDPGTRDFLFWNAASALARGINFWAPLLPEGTQWSTFQRPMQVELDDGVDLNAFYSRDRGLVFFHDIIDGNTVFSGESPDVVCHELGHAVLDAVKPDLFDVASLEVGALHEAFGDMTAMLCALQIPSLREFVLAQTDGDLRLNSRLSQMARELGWAIRQFAPDAVDVDCLRNTANSFFYQDPAALPPSAPAAQLSSEVHSFSRVFSGAFLDVLAAMFETGPAGACGDDSEKLVAISRDAGRLLIEGVRIAPVGAGFYSQVAAGMVQADQSLFRGRYRTALISSFVGRGILAPESGVALARDLRVHAGAAFGVTSAAPAQHLQFEGDNEGYKRTAQDAPAMPLHPLTTRFGTTIHVHLPSAPKRFGVAAAAVAGGADETLSAEDDARSFVEDLIQLDRIAEDEGTGVIPAELISPRKSYPGDKTHRLVREDGKTVLKRRHFCCGFCGRRPGRPVS
ncbi:hypothetical protein VT84_08545 [Gemmata sp. SH-PL17]|uniref:hypothetical protein n=1 Tax=Gemmata sp. SH-PL17 TaxID=1630693 RepID=UPI0004B8AB1B|nr:hypothetical protein [Gemmata sp. SH-PL17]AMV24432.1 hypothetical protein VT84_08545 [Gemmata sp. SH-PL17]